MAEDERPLKVMLPDLDERIKELRALKKSNEEIVIILYDEGYSTKEIMMRRLPLKALKKRPKTDDAVMGAIAGSTKGPGYLDELKVMIRHQISRSRELTEVFSNVGLGTLLASLHKAGLNIDDFRAIALKGEGLKEALMTAGEHAFKALEYYDSDLVSKVEGERDTARAYASQLEMEMTRLVEQLNPQIRLERMLHTYLLSGTANPDVLMPLLDKWLGMEMTEVRLEAMR